MEERIVRLLKERGPQTGAELREALGDDGFGQWKACMRSERIAVRRVGRRYLRLDQRVEGYARLSPSILREFLTYSVVGLTDDPMALEAKTEELAAHIRDISAAKLKLAQRLIGDIGTRLQEHERGEEDRFCVLLAGRHSLRDGPRRRASGEEHRADGARLGPRSGGDHGRPGA